MAKPVNSVPILPQTYCDEFHKIIGEQYPAFLTPSFNPEKVLSIINPVITTNILDKAICPSFEGAAKRFQITEQYLSDPSASTPRALPSRSSFPENCDTIPKFKEYLTQFGNEENTFRWISGHSAIRSLKENYDLPQEQKKGYQTTSRYTLYKILLFLEVKIEHWRKIVLPDNSDQNPSTATEVSSGSNIHFQGTFHFYNREIVAPQQILFQRAILYLGDGKGKFIYKNIRSKNQHEADVFIEKPINHEILPIRIEGKDQNGISRFVIQVNIQTTLFVYQRFQEEINRFYGHYLYQSGESSHVHSSVLILEKIQEGSTPSSPERMLRAIKPDIQKFLLEASLNAGFKTPLLNGAEDDSPQAKAYNKLTRFIGRYYLYCNKRYTYKALNSDILPGNQLISWVGRDVFEIKEGVERNQLICTLTSFGQEDREGVVYIDEKSENQYIICNLHQVGHTNSRFLNLIFPTNNRGEILFGTYNTVYRSKEPVGCGLAIMVKLEEEKSLSAIPGVVDPFDNRLFLEGKELHTEVTSLEEVMINYLSYNAQARLGSFRGRSDLERISRICPYEGVYRVFSYGRIRNDDPEGKRSKAILIGAMEITKYGYVRHRLDYEREYSHGEATIINTSLFITLHNLDSRSIVDNKGRRGTFILKVSSKFPEPGRIYCGVFSGVSYGSANPLGSRIVLECLGKDKSYAEVNCGRIPFNNTHALKNEGIDPRIVRALTGRWMNFVNFIGGQEGIQRIPKLKVDTEKADEISQTFFQSALFYLMVKKDLTNGVKELQRAFEHGKGSFKEIEEELATYGGQELLGQVIANENYIGLKSLYNS